MKKSRNLEQDYSFENTTKSKSATIVIMVTYKCNRNCPFCVAHFSRKIVGDKHISMENIEKAIKFANYQEKKRIELSGGEPSLHPQIIEIAHRLKNAGFYTKIKTNYDFPDVIQQLDGIVDEISVSFYGQNLLPQPKDFPNSKLELSVILDAKKFPTLQALDKFIDEYEDFYQLSFRTLFDVNEYCLKNQTPFLKELDALGTNILTGASGITCTVYRGYKIRRIDMPAVSLADECMRYIVEVDGTIGHDYADVRKDIQKGINTLELREALRATKSSSVREDILKSFEKVDYTSS